MSPSPADVFSELRALLQQKQLSWRDFIHHLLAHMDELSEDTRQIVREEYGPYLERECARRFEDHGRVISLSHTVEDVEPLYRSLARHLHMRYDDTLPTLHNLARYETHWALYPIDHLTMLSLPNLDLYQDLALLELFALHGPRHLTHLSFGLQESVKEVSLSHLEHLLDTLLTLVPAEQMRSLSWRYTASTPPDAHQAHVYAALLAFLPRYTSCQELSLGVRTHDAEHLMTLLDRLPDSVQALSLNLGGHNTALPERYVPEALEPPTSHEDSAHLLNRVLNHPSVAYSESLEMKPARSHNGKT